MDRSVYIAANSVSNLWKAMQVNNHNLANVNTVGFREELMNLKSEVVEGDGLPGRTNSYLTGTYFSDVAGPVVTTANPLDVAIKGQGWISIQNDRGEEAYTRAGEFQLDVNGVLTTRTGNVVVGEGGPITIPPSERISIGADGTVSVQPEGQGADSLVVIDRIKLVNPPRSALTKGEDGFIYASSGAESDPSVQLVSGALEGSNANAIDGFVKMISFQQQLQQNFSMMKIIDEQAQDSARILQVQN